MADRLAQGLAECLALAPLGKVLLDYILFQFCAARLSLFDEGDLIEVCFFALLNRYYLDTFIYLPDFLSQSLFNKFNSYFRHLLNPFDEDICFWLLNGKPL